MRLSALTAAVSVFALVAACGGEGETAAATQTAGAPVETNEANGETGGRSARERRRRDAGGAKGKGDEKEGKKKLFGGWGKERP